jgi:uncharacterized cupredoxin-like copper-binding protein
MDDRTLVFMVGQKITSDLPIKKETQMKLSYQLIALIGIVSALALSGCSPQENLPDTVEAVIANADTTNATRVSFTLKTIVNDGKLAYLGIGGEIDGIVNPDLTVPLGSVVNIILINGDGMPHDLFLPDFNAKTAYVMKVGDQTGIEVEIQDVETGVYVYYCTMPGHRQAGQEGKLIVADP